MKTGVHLWRYRAEFFLEWEMFETKFVEKLKTTFYIQQLFSLKSFRLWDNTEKIWQHQTGNRWQYNTAHTLFICITKAAHTQNI